MKCLSLADCRHGSVTAMPTLPPGWETDLAVLRHTGSLLDDRGDHVLVRSPHNPTFHWGNLVFVTDGEAVDDAQRWVAVFHEAFPEAGWVSVGLIRFPNDPTPWVGEGLDVELDEVLTTTTLPRQTPLADGYTVRQLQGDDDWAAYVERALLDNERTQESEPTSHAHYMQAQARARRGMSERGVAAFFGAFDGDTLAADLGIVRCGTTARYQSVGTDEDHRRRGLAAHLLGVAAQWSAERGCSRWVIITESTNPAGRVYRSVGFEPDLGNAQAYRKPPR